MSYGDAQPLLAALRGPVAPESWRGALPITYHIGPGPAKVHMRVKSNWDTKRLYDVIVRIPGSEYPDEWIVRGNHHDAWVNGAEDLVSGMARNPGCSVRRSGPRLMPRIYRSTPSSISIAIPTAADF